MLWKSKKCNSKYLVVDRDNPPPPIQSTLRSWRPKHGTCSVLDLDEFPGRLLDYLQVSRIVNSLFTSPLFRSAAQSAAAGDPVPAGGGAAGHQVQRGAPGAGAVGEGDRAGGARLRPRLRHVRRRLAVPRQLALAAPRQVSAASLHKGIRSIKCNLQSWSLKLWRQQLWLVLCINSTQLHASSHFWRNKRVQSIMTLKDSSSTLFYLFYNISLTNFSSRLGSFLDGRPLILTNVYFLTV